MNILVLRSYGDYVILLNSLRNTTIKTPIHLIISSHLKPLHEALSLNFSNNIIFNFIEFKINKGILGFFTNKYLFSLSSLKELMAIRQYAKTIKNSNNFLEHNQRSLILKFILGIRFKYIYNKNNIYETYRVFFEANNIFKQFNPNSISSNSRIIIFPDSRKKGKVINEKTISELEGLLNEKGIQFKIACFNSGNKYSINNTHEIFYSNFFELVELIKKFDFIISSDSLPVHIAELYNKPHWILYNHKINSNWLTASSASSKYYSTFEQTSLIKKIFN